MILQDLRYSVRQLYRNPTFTVISVLTLTLGIGANTAIFTLVENVLLRPLSFDHPEQLYVVHEISNHNETAKLRLSGPDFDDLRENARSLEAVSAVIPYFTYTLTGEGEPRNLKVTAMTKDFFPLLGIHPLMGRLYTPQEYHIDSGAVVISHRMWVEQLNKDPHVIGRSITLQGVSMPIIGVMPDLPDVFSDIDVWAKVIPDYEFMQWRKNKFLTVYARLKPGVTRQQAEQELTSILTRSPEQPPNLSVELVPMKEELTGKIGTQLKLIMSAALLVLIIACINVMYLLLARMSERVSEVAVRLSLGAKPQRILKQFVTENLLLASIGAGLGMVLAVNIVHFVKSFGLTSLPREQQIGINIPVLGVMIGVIIVFSVVCAWIPAGMYNRLNLNVTLKSGRASVGRPRGFRALVISEVSCAVVLVIVAGLLLRSFWLVQHVDPGFVPDHLLTAYLRTHYYDATGATFYNQLLENLSHMPGVKHAAVADCLPGAKAATTNIDFSDRPNDPAHPISVEGCWVSPDFFQSIGTSLEQGRFFSLADNADAPPVIIVNKAFVRTYWPDQNPIGKRIAVSYLGPGRKAIGPARFREVVGIVADVKQRALDLPAKPALYMPFYQDETNHVYAGMSIFVRTSGEPTQQAMAIRKVIQGMNPNQAIQQMRTMEDVLSSTLTSRKLSLILVGAFAFLALLLCAIGIYGTIAYSVSQRTRELGLRLALGATRGKLLELIMREGMLLVAIGLAVGLAVSFMVSRMISSMLFGITSFDPVTFMMASVILCIIAAAACFFPALKSSRMDPLEALRVE
ncbi:MAG TPA: ABC transporter permease [Candidatus Angelobacter sp.]|nr:ABC transporter permease [Candidatus Angelobacter sp.]